MYDWFLGGKDNYEADRQACAEVEKIYPAVRTAALANRRADSDRTCSKNRSAPPGLSTRPISANAVL
nr:MULTISPECIES: SAM-dependent methyltransferase [Nocardia]